MCQAGTSFGLETRAGPVPLPFVMKSVCSGRALALQRVGLGVLPRFGEVQLSLWTCSYATAQALPVTRGVMAARLSQALSDPQSAR